MLLLFTQTEVGLPLIGLVSVLHIQQTTNKGKQFQEFLRIYTRYQIADSDSPRVVEATEHYNIHTQQNLI